MAGANELDAEPLDERAFAGPGQAADADADRLAGARHEAARSSWAWAWWAGARDSRSVMARPSTARSDASMPEMSDSSLVFCRSCEKG
jgi:hypothetical protein